MPGRIAVLDDNVDCSQILKLLLSPEYEVDDFDSGSSFKEALLEGVYDLAIVDLIVQGELAGLDMLRFVRGTHCLSDLPVILATGDSVRFDKESAFNTGFDGFLVKPFEFEDLFSLVANLTNRRAKKSVA